MEDIVTKRTPSVDYASLTPTQMADIGLNAAQRAFEGDVVDGLTTNDSFALSLGALDSARYVEWGCRNLGPDAAEFVDNIGPETGKLATVVTFGTSSHVAYQRQGTQIPAGPQRWTGGVHYVELVETRDRGWLQKEFGGAGSGVQGHLDKATVLTGLSHMGAAWALQQQALYGKPEPSVPAPAEVVDSTTAGA